MSTAWFTEQIVKKTDSIASAARTHVPNQGFEKQEGRKPTRSSAAIRQTQHKTLIYSGKTKVKWDKTKSNDLRSEVSEAYSIVKILQQISFVF